MRSFRFDRLLEAITSVDLLVILLWLGLAGLTIALLVLMRTRWGESRPLRKCLVLSILAHLLLAGYATTVSIVTSGPLQAKEPAIRVSIDQPQIEDRFETRDLAIPPEPWESFVHESVGEPEPVDLARSEPVELPEPQRQPRPQRHGVSEDPTLEDFGLAEAAPPDPENVPTDAPAERAPSSPRAAAPIQAPPAKRREGARVQTPGPPEPKRRPARADTPELPPVRSNRAGLPSPLLDRPLPMPRLAHVQPTPDPEPALAGIRDSLTRGSQGEPAEWSDPQAPQVGARAESASTPGTGPTAANTEHLKPPSVALRGGSSRSGSRLLDVNPGANADIGPPVLPLSRRNPVESQVPAIYRLRVAPDRSRLAQLRGATPQTEECVKAALAWLAKTQAPDGRWHARAHGAGREQFVAGRDRQGAGVYADTGLTGLALLAFLASGHTHQEGPYQENVRRGLEYLVGTQANDGNLGGSATMYAFMYCHAMATCALSEAYGMTGDRQLQGPVQRAVAYTLAAQDPSAGGWRYHPGEPGDTSQLGWQLMALRSADLAGIPLPERSRQGALRYLDAASSGQYGGLAGYRPVEAPSRPMTAEALVCRILLGMTPTNPTAKEAGNYLLRELPGEGRKNLYYWYYGTLGMYYLQGTHWHRWNTALQRTLVGSQQKTGEAAGSWDPNTVWGGYGGRVYSTALATLCLEVYYRFLPLYVEASAPRPLLR
jgi:hypothetical protein